MTSEVLINHLRAYLACIVKFVHNVVTKGKYVLTRDMRAE